MNLKHLLVAALVGVSLQASAIYRYVGGDISLLPEYEEAGAQYKDADGKPIAELLPFLHAEGMNAMRVRLFVNSKDYTGKDKDPNACQDLDYIIPLCQRIQKAGFALMLDFHYSDTWADPAKQWTPKAWGALTDDQLYQKIYDYTKESLQTLADNGVVPEFIQPGNEISYGMLWGTEGTPESQLKKTFMGSDANWKRLATLLNQAIKACKEECPDAKIVLHTERVAQPDVQNNFYKKIEELSVNYDIIGLSYYPYFHGNLSVLEKALSALEKDFPSKNIMIVETGYPYAWEVPGTTEKVDYPYSEEGQNEFAAALVKLLREHDSVDGLFWWWLEYNAYNTSLKGWYNAPLFDSRTGQATRALATICSFAEGNDAAVGEITGDGDDATRQWYNLQGIPVDNPTQPGLYISRDKKIIIR